MRRTIGLLGAVLCSCGYPGTSAPPAREPPTSVAVPELPVLLEEELNGGYLPSERALGYGEQYFGGKGRALVNGIRVADGESPSTDSPQVLLTGGVQLPSHFGGGFLFWNVEELFVSRSFTGPLVPAGRLPKKAAVARVSFGISSVLLHYQGGGRSAWSPSTRRFTALPEPGLMEMAAGADGRAAMVKEPGQLWVRQAGVEGAFIPWKDPRLEVSELGVVRGVVLARTRLGESLALDENGNLVPYPTQSLTPRNGRALPSPSGRGASSSLRALAMKEGLSLDGMQAVVFAEGVFAKFDLRNGANLRFSPPPAASVVGCRLLPMPPKDVLALCRTADNDAVVFSSVWSLKPKLVRWFEGPARFAAGAPGTLLKEGACGKWIETATEESVCVRQPNGSWVSFEVDPALIVGEEAASEEALPDVAPSEEIASDEAPSKKQNVRMTIVRWIPTSDGGALGLVAGARPGLLDVKNRRFVPVKASGEQLGVFGRSSDYVRDEFEALPNGGIAGYVAEGSVSLVPGGKVEYARKFVGGAHSSGALALAQDQQNRFWQSVDHGRNWESIREPVRSLGHPVFQLQSCSQVGCIIDDWWRLGYPAASVGSRMAVDSAHSPIENPTRIAELRCQSVGPAHQQSLDFIYGDREEPPGIVPHLGVRKSRTPPQNDLEGGVSAGRFQFSAFDSGLIWADAIFDFPWDEEDSPKFVRAMRTTHELEYLVPLSKPRVRQTRVSFSTIVHKLGADASPFSLGTEGRALPVLAVDGRSPDGVLVVDGADAHTYGFWLRDGEAPRAYLFPQERTEGPITSAVAKKGGALVVAQKVNGQFQAYELSPGNPAWAHAALPTNAEPPRPDVVMMGPGDRPALLRMWSAGSPTADDPALAFFLDGSQKRLAPFATVVAGPCGDAPGLRGIIPLQDWVVLSLDGVPAPAGSGQLGLVHWTEQRLCIEALELPHQGSFNPTQGDVMFSVSATFGQVPTAYRHRYGIGEEYLQQLSCKLVTE
jgi:hypothetical protein